MNSRKRQIQEAEDLFGKTRKRSFAQQLFAGKLDAELLFPYPRPTSEAESELTAYLGKIRAFLKTEVDPAKIDAESHIPDSVVRGLFDLKVMSMSIPRDHGGLGFSQYAYCRVMEEIGAVDASLAILVNAHQSIGLKSLLLFGSPQQRLEWLPKLARGEILAAFALTEPNAGSDAGGVETRAVLNAEGSHYILNGEKQWITNGSTAGLITVMAKVPHTKDRKGRERITAFLVTPDMPGFEIKAATLDKCGIRGTVTSKLLFRNLRVPVSNVIGPFGEGLRVALTLLDFGRTTFGASCTGAAQLCVRDAIEHARTRHQFGKALIEFEMVQAKISRIASLAFAMESATHLTANLIDRNVEDYMVETAMLKVFASESLWEIVNETIQIFGGSGYFTDLPYERMMRDARINMIGEGANDVLRTLIALVGARAAGFELKETLDGSIWSAPGKLWTILKRQIPGGKNSPPFQNAQLQELGKLLGKLIRQLQRTVTGNLIRHGEAILEKQYIQKRLADAATEIYVMSTILSRLASLLQKPKQGDEDPGRALQLGTYYCLMAAQRVRANLSSTAKRLDPLTSSLAEEVSIPRKTNDRN